MGAIQGSVFVNGSAGQNTVTLPQSGLTLVGISQLQQAAPNAAIIPIDSQNNAIFPVGVTGTVNSPIIPFTAPVTGQVINVTLVNAQVFALYYGIPSPDDPNLTDYAGVYANVSIAASTTSVNVTFSVPVPTVLTGIWGDTTDTYAYLSIQTGAGYTLNYLFATKSAGVAYSVGNLKLPTSMTVILNTASNASATVALVILYYAYGVVTG
ncbi:MAG: hypothetical protein QW429_04025 [Thermoprotei archaeon]